MHFVGIARVGPGLRAYFVDRVGIQAREVARRLVFGVTTRHDGLRPPFFQRCVVEERIRPRVEGFGRERRRRREIARDHFDLARAHAAQHREPAFGVHRVVQAVVERLRDERMLGHFALADEVLRAGHLVGEHGREEIFGLHALQLRRDLLAADEARQRQARRRVPAPAHAEQRRVEQRLHEDVERRIRVQVRSHFDQREAVAGRKRQHDRIFGRRGLQFEIELAAEAFAQRQAPGAIHAPAEGRMHDELRAAGFVEEALQHDALLRRHGAERGDLPCEVVGELACGGFVEAHLAGEERHVGSSLASTRSANAVRRRETPEESSSVRPGASPSQNGMLGGMPCASSTRRRPASTRRMR